MKIISRNKLIWAKQLRICSSQVTLVWTACDGKFVWGTDVSDQHIWWARHTNTFIDTHASLVTICEMLDWIMFMWLSQSISPDHKSVKEARAILPFPQKRLHEFIHPLLCHMRKNVIGSECVDVTTNNFWPRWFIPLWWAAWAVCLWFGEVDERINTEKQTKGKSQKDISLIQRPWKVAHHGCFISPGVQTVNLPFSVQYKLCGFSKQI